jgi:hypothetical protein
MPQRGTAPVHMAARAFAAGGMGRPAVSCRRSARASSGRCGRVTVTGAPLSDGTPSATAAASSGAPER